MPRTIADMLKKDMTIEERELRGYTSKLLRRDVFGICKVRMAGCREIWKFIRTVMEGQPHDPRRPTGEIERLRQAVIEKLDSLGLGIKMKRLKRMQVFTAVDSGPDDYFGVRGFIRFETKIVLLDCVLADPDPDELKARVLITGKDMLNGYAVPALAVASRLKPAIEQQIVGCIC